MILVSNFNMLEFLGIMIVLYIVVKIGLKKCDEQEKQSKIEYNKTMQEIRRKAGCKDIHAWDFKNI